jgi:hypothetical protein
MENEQGEGEKVETEAEKLSKEILKIHDEASEIRKACYGQFIHSGNTELINKALEDLGEIGVLAKQQHKNPEGETEGNEIVLIDGFLHGQVSDLQDVLDATDTIEREALRSVVPIEIELNNI